VASSKSGDDMGMGSGIYAYTGPNGFVEIDASPTYYSDGVAFTPADFAPPPFWRRGSRPCFSGRG